MKDDRTLRVSRTPAKERLSILSGKHAQKSAIASAVFVAIFGIHSTAQELTVSVTASCTGQDEFVERVKKLCADSVAHILDTSGSDVGPQVLEIVDGNEVKKLIKLINFPGHTGDVTSFWEELNKKLEILLVDEGEGESKVTITKVKMALEHLIKPDASFSNVFTKEAAELKLVEQPGVRPLPHTMAGKDPRKAAKALASACMRVELELSDLTSLFWDSETETVSDPRYAEANQALRELRAPCVKLRKYLVTWHSDDKGKAVHK